MPNKRRRSLSGPPTPARATEVSSVHSVSASNDYIESLVNYFKMPRDHTTAKAHWDENMELHFCMTYVEWKKSGEWNPNIATEANWQKLAAHLNSQWQKQYGWSVYHSKFSRLKRIWRAFAKLKGLRHSTETGIGWDESKRCFLADDYQWNNLQMEHQDYRNFRYQQCVDKYMILSEVLEGETATGSQAVSSAVPPSSVARQKRATQYGGQSSSVFNDELLHVGADEDSYEEAPKAGNKRGSSSQGATFSVHGSRGSKSSRSSAGDPFVECAHSLSNLASAKLKIKDRRETHIEKFDVDSATMVVDTFPEFDKGTKLAALYKLQDDKWRKTFLTMTRDMQEFWLRKVEIEEKKDSGPQE